MMLLYTLHVCFSVFSICLTESIGNARARFEHNYSLRRNLMEVEEREYSGNEIVLEKDELVVNAYLEFLKWEEFRATKDNFLPSRPIQNVLKEIKSSTVYRVLKQFPKGGNMHTHQNFILSRKKMLDIIFNSSLLLDKICFKTESNSVWRLNFFESPPYGWTKVSSNLTLHTKEYLLQHLTLINVLNSNATSNPTNSDIRWKLFDPLWSEGDILASYLNYATLHLHAMFESAMEENVQYIESRASGNRLYILDNQTEDGHLNIDTTDGDLWMSLLRQQINVFAKKHKDFIGYREIVSTRRSQTKGRLYKGITRAIRLRQKYPDIVCGLDIDAYEDNGYSLLYFLEDFAKIKTDSDQNIPCYFHTSESNWPRDLITSVHDDDPVSTMNNMYDAILLGAKRVGHGLGFVKQPHLMNVLKEKKIAIEVNPVSNMLLGYVTDQRNHPAVTYIRAGIPVVLGADVPGIMGYDEFTVDWYEAFMGWGLNLRDLKQLAINSLEYSSMTDVEKLTGLEIWNKAYVKFIQEIKQEACDANLSMTQSVFHSIFPSAGFVHNSTEIKVFGRHFQAAICNNIICKFGIYESRGLI